MIQHWDAAVTALLRITCVSWAATVFLIVAGARPAGAVCLAVSIAGAVLTVAAGAQTCECGGRISTWRTTREGLRVRSCTGCAATQTCPHGVTSPCGICDVRDGDR